MNILGIEIPEYNTEENPTKCAETAIIDWTINRRDVLALEKLFKAKCKGVKKKRSLIKNKRNSSELLEQHRAKNKRKSEVSLSEAFNKSEVIKQEIKDENYTGISSDASNIIKNEIKTEIVQDSLICTNGEN